MKSVKRCVARERKPSAFAQRGRQYQAAIRNRQSAKPTIFMNLLYLAYAILTRVALCSVPLMSDLGKQQKGEDMNALADANAQASGASETTGQRIRATLQVIGVAVGLVGGVAAGVFGGLLIAAGWLSVNEGARHWLSSAGSALLVLTIPLIILGALCLDWMEKGQSQNRLSHAVDDDDE